MKKILFSVTVFLLALPAWTHTLKLKEFDQYKLAEFLDRLPDTVATRTVTKRSSFSRNYSVHHSFPKKSNAFLMECESFFVEDSEVPLDVDCVVTINKKSKKAIIKHHVLRVNLRKSEAKAVYDAIPYGRPVKKLYSYGRGPGITYTGVKNVVHHYQFLCTETLCRMNFSTKRLVK